LIRIFLNFRKAEILDDDERSLENMNKVIDTNFRGVLHCTRKAFKLMSKSDDYGLIININSIAGHIIPFLSFSMNAYSPTKFAVTSLTETIRQELFRANNRKIRVTVRFESHEKILTTVLIFLIF
jgi:NADP+-dependent farnesol dehydrogenase